ncbi:MAG: murein biosynthesis integral membrane protein MurJ [Alphaproteobacteria bacterium]
MALYRAIATLGSWTMLSRILGFVRDMLLAGVLGAGMVADAFFVAFKFPNFFRRLFAEGAFNAAFVPLYARRLEQDGQDAARGFAGEVAAVMTAWLLVFTAIAQAAMPWLMLVLAPGFSDQPEKFALAVDLTQITFPYLMFMALVALLGGMLNAHHRFAATAAAPIVLNLVLIATLGLVKAGLLPLPGQAVSWGVIVAGAGQFAWLAWACHRQGIAFRVPVPSLTPGVRRLLRLMVPGLMGAGVVQINLVIDVMLASLLPEGSVSWLYYADRVNQLPLGVVGVAIGVALLPMLSRQLSAGDLRGAADSQNRAVELGLLLTLPAAAALVAIPGPIVGVLFQRGAFQAGDAAATSAALGAFAMGLPGYVLIKALVPAFFAREDTATPVKVAVAAMLLNIGLALALMPVLAHVGIALATATAAWANAGLLAWLLHRRGLLQTDARLRRRAPRILLAAAAMAGALWLGARALEGAFAGPLWHGVPALAALVLGGMVCYGALAQLTGAASFRDIRGALRRGEVAPRVK